MCKLADKEKVPSECHLLTCGSLPRQLASQATRSPAGGLQRHSHTDGTIKLCQAELGEEYIEFLRFGTSELLQSLPMQDSLPRIQQKRASNRGLIR